MTHPISIKGKNPSMNMDGETSEISIPEVPANNEKSDANNAVPMVEPKYPASLTIVEPISLLSPSTVSIMLDERGPPQNAHVNPMRINARKIMIPSDVPLKYNRTKANAIETDVATQNQRRPALSDHLAIGMQNTNVTTGGMNSNIPDSKLPYPRTISM